MAYIVSPGFLEALEKSPEEANVVAKTLRHFTARGQANVARLLQEISALLPGSLAVHHVKGPAYENTMWRAGRAAPRDPRSRLHDAYCVANLYKFAFAAQSYGQQWEPTPGGSSLDICLDIVASDCHSGRRSGCAEYCNINNGESADKAQSQYLERALDLVTAMVLTEAVGDVEANSHFVQAFSQLAGPLFRGLETGF